MCYKVDLITDRTNSKIEVLSALPAAAAESPTTNRRQSGGSLLDPATASVSFEYPTSFANQVWVLFQRTFFYKARDHITVYSLSLALLLGLVVGLCFFQTKAVTSQIMNIYFYVGFFDDVTI